MKPRTSTSTPTTTRKRESRRPPSSVRRVTQTPSSSVRSVTSPQMPSPVRRVLQTPSPVRSVTSPQTPSSSVQRDTRDRYDTDKMHDNVLMGIMVEIVDHDRELNMLFCEPNPRNGVHEWNIPSLSSDIQTLSESENLDIPHVCEMLRVPMTKQLTLIQNLAPPEMKKRYEIMCEVAKTRMNAISNNNWDDLDKLIILRDSVDDILSDVFSHNKLNDDDLKTQLSQAYRN